MWKWLVRVVRPFLKYATELLCNQQFFSIKNKINYILLKISMLQIIEQELWKKKKKNTGYSEEVKNQLRDWSSKEKTSK